MKVWFASYDDRVSGYTYDAIGHAKGETIAKVARAVRGAHSKRGLTFPRLRDLVEDMEVCQMELGKVYLDRGKAGEAGA